MRVPQPADSSSSRAEVGKELAPATTTLVPASPTTVVAPLGPAQGARPRWLKPLAAILIAYGTAGVMLAAILLVVGLQVWPLVQLLLGQVAASLHATALTLGAAAVAAGGAGASLDQAQQVASAASETTLQASNNLRQLAQAMDIQVLGARPFGDLAPRLTDTADNLQQLGTSLAGAGQALAQNGTQSGAMQTNLTTMQQQLSQLGRVGPGDGAGAADAVRRSAVAVESGMVDVPVRRRRHFG
jgi:hypothetical protein